MTRSAAAVRRLVPLALALVLLAGCGGDGGGGQTSKDDYIKEVNAVGQTLKTELSDVGQQISAQADPKGIASKLDAGAKTLDGAADKLDDIDPPSDAKGPHAQIVAGIHALADLFRKGATQAGKGQLDALVKTFQQVAASAGIKQIDRATRQLERAGYAVK